MRKFALIDITQCGQRHNARPWSSYYFHLWVSIIGNHSELVSAQPWSLEKEMATHSSILARQRSLVGRSPWAPKRVGHYLVTKQQQSCIHWSFDSSQTESNSHLGFLSSLYSWYGICLVYSYLDLHLSLVITTLFHSSTYYC